MSSSTIWICSFSSMYVASICSKNAYTSTVFSFLKTDHCWHIFWLIWKRHLFDQITIKMRNGVALQLVYYYYTYNFRIHSLLFSMTMKYKQEYYMLLRIKNILHLIFTRNSVLEYICCCVWKENVHNLMEEKWRQARKKKFLIA